MVNIHLLLILAGVSWHITQCWFMMLQPPVVHPTLCGRLLFSPSGRKEQMSVFQLLQYKAQQHSWSSPLMVLYAKTLVVVSKHSFPLPPWLPVRTAGNSHVLNSCSRILRSSRGKALREETLRDANGSKGTQLSLMSMGLRCLISFYIFITASF